MMSMLDIEPEPDEPSTPALVDLSRGPVLNAEERLARRSTDMVSRAQSVVIMDGPSYEAAGMFLEQLKGAIGDIEAFFEDDIANAYATWHGLTSKRKRYIDPLKAAHTIISDRYTAYNRAAVAKAEDERRAREEAARREEEARLLRESEAKLAESRRLAEEAEKAVSREEGIALEARAADAAEEARELRQDAATVEAPVLPLQPDLPPVRAGAPKVRANWTFEVTDAMKLCKAIAAGEVSLEAFTPNEKYLRRRAEADKATCRIPGVRVYDAGTVTQTRRK